MGVLGVLLPRQASECKARAEYSPKSGIGSDRDFEFLLLVRVYRDSLRLAFGWARRGACASRRDGHRWRS